MEVSPHIAITAARKKKREQKRSRLKVDAGNGVLTFSFSPEIIVHSLARRTTLQTISGAHKGKIGGICMATGDRLLSCGHDRNVKLWDLNLPNMDDGEEVIDATQNSVNEDTAKPTESTGMPEPGYLESLGTPLLVYPSKMPLKYVALRQPKGETDPVA